MGWQDLLSQNHTQTLAWLGGKTALDAKRSYRIQGRRPQHRGWHQFQVQGRRATWVSSEEEITPPYEVGGFNTVRGYLAGNRLIADGSAYPPQIQALFGAPTVYGLPPGLDPFTRVLCWEVVPGESMLYLGIEFPAGPEPEVLIAFEDQLSIDSIPGVDPALHAAFSFLREMERVEEEQNRLLRERQEAEVRALREQAAREAAEQERLGRLEEMRRNIGSAAGRRNMAQQDLRAACLAALQVSGAELISVRESYSSEESVVRFRFLERRFECVINSSTLAVTEAGICLTDEMTGERGDTRFTLESLPSVIREAIDLDVLVVFRHV